ncbi:MAG TPA: M56 family metallopeptidase [Mycobacteriales bacterium]|nr:M56 family metallopeptidase [Mycobacteriales bacterium]
MRIEVYLPFLVSVLFGASAPAVARRLPPAQGTWLLTIGSAVVAVSSALSLGLLAFTFLGRQPEIAELGHVGVGTFRRHDPVHVSVALSALVLIPILGGLLIRTATQRVRALIAAYRICRGLPDAGTPLVVDPDPGLAAYAVPGRPGRIVVSRSLLAALPAPERRALLAHERAHLDRHHHWHLTVVALAAGVDPLLGRLVAAARHATERWADEIAADAVGDRAIAATALARTSLLQTRSGPLAAMGAAGSHVTERVRILLCAPPRNRPVLVALAAACVIGAATGALAAGWDAHGLVELAQRS